MEEQTLESRGGLPSLNDEGRRGSQDFRCELKHFINAADHMELSSRLGAILRLDENVISGRAYRVTSVYFDNHEDKILREKVNGYAVREKFRLRYYNGDTGFIRLEKKSKQNSLTSKESTIITDGQCRRLIAGNADSPFKTDDPLLLELLVKMRTQNLRPRAVIDYLREAYIHPMGNTRVTIDYDLRHSENVRVFLSEKRPGIPIGSRVLEIKYDNFLPGLVRDLVQLRSRKMDSFSKYAAARMG